MIEYESLARSNIAYMAELEEAATRVIRNGWYVLGQEVSAFEAEFAKYLGVKHCVGVANGLDALILAIEALDLPKGSDVLVACCLLHIPEYAKGVSETARVARRYAIFHRTPVVWGQPEQWYRKQAYGVETVEIHFNEPEFLASLDNNGLELIATHTLSEESTDATRAQGHASRTYVCRKKDK